MGYIHQVSASKANSSQFLLSAFVRAPQSTFNAPLGGGLVLEYGDNSNDGFACNYIFLTSNSPKNDFFAQFWSGTYPYVTDSTRKNVFTSWANGLGGVIAGDFSQTGFGSPVPGPQTFFGSFHFLTQSGTSAYTCADFALANQNNPASPLHPVRVIWDTYVGGAPLNQQVNGYIYIIIDNQTADPPSNTPLYYGVTTMSPTGAAPEAVSSVFNADAWNHILLSANLSDTARVDTVATGPDARLDCQVIKTNKFWYAINDVDKSPTIIPDASPTVEAMTFPSGSVLPRVGFFRGSNFESHRANWGPLQAAGSATLFPLPIIQQGHEFGIPGCDWDTVDIGLVEMAHFQMWVGKSMDLSSVPNRRRFLTATGRPTSWGSTWAALGTPTYAFRRGQANFSTNEGNGGSFLRVGTLTDFTPGP